MNKEQVYDDQISPLMLQIIDICKAKGIAMMASFDIAHDGEGPNGEDCSGLICSSLLPDENGDPNPSFMQANALIRGHRTRSTMHLATVHTDGSKTLTAFI
ncbi:hypothetical protein ALP50_01152 [Pseudomonas syringae pv. spinaceae]|uniref:Uncharacterized protein n=1 Tax=Pseudomonas syringae pv. spinaceae TaxID=264459 RepID=A0A0Q0AQJ0_PSESX|nr:hypothetical protein [Pseudomonas syringae]KPY66142.1 Uncharacterized protein ALO94_01995 [Pseudomonas syringae pv. spinaceae]RMT27186.1 hypothetical protein ALP50_01152 [Pseudomonas syringae pv. spinaceae]